MILSETMFWNILKFDKKTSHLESPRFCNRMISAIEEGTLMTVIT